ncbi:hypothetical protein DICSQDRAFT_49269 [Dichomitus squalens LYAD-421 SS1]|uniref:uncharacterized protein n=1 Tax=Dichomitus squalens (strain LYAD-421) TaxID=732165 RepID=UPI00044138F4|nr:uncharacterized protein DICSQDRAFT_49269 [Dichomitus squalens LYAD-421 SS1]EJF65995.1 hypothetical protein DICSQDRAFT_49269 [Dichomitus squalens LYAD-421 SS1]
MLAFEYFTTLDREIDFLWDHKLSWAKVVSLLNRYIGLLYYFCSFAISLPGQDFSVSARFTITIFPTAFAGLRAHAVTMRNWKITLPIVLLGLTTVIIDSIVFILSRTCALLSNGLVLAATWVQTWSTIRTAREFGLSASFASFLLWHGLQTFGYVDPVGGCTSDLMDSA